MIRFLFYTHSLSHNIPHSHSVQISFFFLIPFNQTLPSSFFFFFFFFFLLFHFKPQLPPTHPPSNSVVIVAISGNPIVLFLSTPLPWAVAHHHFCHWPCLSKHCIVVDAFHTYDHSLMSNPLWSRLLPLIANMVVIFIPWPLFCVARGDTTCKETQKIERRKHREQLSSKQWRKQSKHNFFCSLKNGILKT